MYRSLDTYYNWCLDKANKFNIVKWDADFLAINDNLIEMLERYDLSSLDKKTAIWFSGKTIFKNKNEFFVNLNTGYNEFRIFSKLHGYKWDYAPRWEISSRIFMHDCEKIVYTKSVYLELKDLEINEFEHRTNGAFISTCTRDSQDYALMSLIKNGEYSDQKKILACGIEPTDFVQIDFNPLLPTFYDTTQFNRYECTFKELESLQEYWLNNYSQKSKPILFQNPGNLIVQGLWVGEKITDLHRMCVESFIKNGHCFILYVYDDVANLPDGVVIMNAAEILPESLVYKFNDSYAGFSDIFRSKLLYSRGGWYVDLDIFNLKRFDFSNKMVYSLDHYPENGPVVVSETGMTIFPVNEKYYCATNPIKMPKGHSMAEAMYRRCFEKIFSERMFADVFGRDSNIHVHRERLEGYITNMGLISDFNAYFTDVRQLNELISFSDILAKTRISIDDMGQKTWNEIGPRLVTKKVLEYGLSDCMFEPWYFQGFIPYYEAEKFIDPNFDFRSPLELQNGYSIDLFFTMWRNKELLEKKDRIDGTFYKYLQSLVNH